MSRAAGVETFKSMYHSNLRLRRAPGADKVDYPPPILLKPCLLVSLIVVLNLAIYKQVPCPVVRQIHSPLRILHLLRGRIAARVQKPSGKEPFVLGYD